VAAPGQTLAILIDPGKLYISANIEETKLGRLKPGQKVDIVIDQFGGKKFSGKIKSESFSDYTCKAIDIFAHICHTHTRSIGCPSLMNNIRFCLFLFPVGSLVFHTWISLNSTFVLFFATIFSTSEMIHILFRSLCTMSLRFYRSFLMREPFRYILLSSSKCLFGLC
jgi:hypothetical protein